MKTTKRTHEFRNLTLHDARTEVDPVRRSVHDDCGGRTWAFRIRAMGLRDKEDNLRARGARLSRCEMWYKHAA